jgi:ferric-dicitrate binding protein FerR (iron transport regulator)
MRLSNQDDLRIAEEAALWVVRLRREDSPAVREEFDAWCSSPRHMREFMRARATARRLDVLARMPLGARHAADASNILFFRPRNGARLAPRKWHGPRDVIAAWLVRLAAWISSRTGRGR